MRSSLTRVDSSWIHSRLWNYCDRTRYLGGTCSPTQQVFERKKKTHAHIFIDRSLQGRTNWFWLQIYTSFDKHSSGSWRRNPRSYRATWKLVNIQISNPRTVDRRSTDVVVVLGLSSGVLKKRFNRWSPKNVSTSIFSFLRNDFWASSWQKPSDGRGRFFFGRDSRPWCWTVSWRRGSLGKYLDVVLAYIPPNTPWKYLDVVLNLSYTANIHFVNKLCTKNQHPEVVRITLSDLSRAEITCIADLRHEGVKVFLRAEDKKKDSWPNTGAQPENCAQFFNENQLKVFFAPTSICSGVFCIPIFAMSSLTHCMYFHMVPKERSTKPG